MTTPGIPNDYSLSTTCFGTRLGNIQDQIFAAVGMGFRRLELGLAETPPSMEGLEDSRRETGVAIPSLVAGCRDPLNGRMAVERLGSLVSEERDRALFPRGPILREHAAQEARGTIDRLIPTTAPGRTRFLHPTPILAFAVPQGGAESLACERGPNCTREISRHPRLRNEAECAEFQGAIGERVVLMHRQNDDSRLRAQFLHRPQSRTMG